MAEVTFTPEEVAGFPQGPPGADGLPGPQGVAGPPGPKGDPGSGSSGVGLNVRDFGAVGDDATDDGPAIQAAIDAAAVVGPGSSGGGLVWVPKGSYVVTSKVVVKDRVRLVGEDARASRVRAGASFPATTPVVQLGTGSVVSFNTRVEDLTIDAGNVAGSTGVYSAFANEQAGVHRCLITNFRDYGIVFATTGCQHAEIESCEVYGSAAGWTGGIHLSGTGGMTYINKVTVNAQSNTVDGTYGLLVDGGGNGAFDVGGMHVENVTHGVYVANGSGGSVRSLEGGAGVVNLLTVGPSFGSSLVAQALSTTSGVLINDLPRGKTSGTSTNMGLFVLDGVGATKGRIVSGKFMPSFENGLWHFAGGAAMLTKSGVPVDADFPVVPPNGTVAIDISVSPPRWYVRKANAFVAM